jgi:hypothetical protein
MNGLNFSFFGLDMVDPELVAFPLLDYSASLSAYKLPQPIFDYVVGGYLSDYFLAPWLFLFFGVYLV